MNALPLARAAAAHARTRSLVGLLRTPDLKPIDWEEEREALAQAGGPMPIGGWDTVHDADAKTYTQIGTICGVRVTPPRVGHYHCPVNNIDSMGDATVHHVARITGETFTDIVCNGRRRWFGPDG